MLATFWAAFKAKVPPNRAAAAIMATLTPVLAIAAGNLATWSTIHLAQLHLTTGQLFGVFVTGAAAVVFPAVTAGYQWFTGWIQRDAHKQALERALVDHGEFPDEAAAKVKEAHP
jgi:hypothetical protein